MRRVFLAAAAALAMLIAAFGGASKAAAAPGDCTGPISAVPSIGLTNIGFETGNLAGWKTGTITDSVTVTGPDGSNSPYEGSFMARLGTPGFSGQPIGPNELCQDFRVDSSTEAFVYDIFTHDYTGFDDFKLRLSVVDPASGEVLAAHQQGAWGSGTALKTSGWKYVSFDLADHIGQVVRLYLTAGGTLDTLYRFWAYVDSAESGPPPVVAPLGSATSTTGSVMTDPQTGQVTVAMPAGNKSALTISSPIKCPGGGTPSSVTLNLNGNHFPMASAGGTTYQVTIPAAQVQSGAVTIEVVCPTGNFVNTIGTIQLYDPSGIVSNALTGEPVVGAEVTLFKVPGWSPGPGGAAASQCQSSGPPWTQPAPAALGVEVNPVLNPQIEPDVNPFVTNSIGWYGWDVASGCWYVEVSHPDYQTLTSPVVGVPPAVTTLDLELMPLGESVPPVTTAGQTPAANGAGWNNTNVSVGLHATDEAGGSGVKHIVYSRDGGTTSTTVAGDSATVLVSAEGTTTITYYAVDNANNAEAPQTRVVRIDKTAPAVSCKATPDRIWSPNGKLVAVTVAVGVADKLSGPAGFVLSSLAMNEPGAVAASSQGWITGSPDTGGLLRAERSGKNKSGRVYTLRYTGRDVAGNTKTCDATVLVPHDNRA